MINYIIIYGLYLYLYQEKNWALLGGLDGRRHSLMNDHFPYLKKIGWAWQAPSRLLLLLSWALFRSLHSAGPGPLPGLKTEMAPKKIQLTFFFLCCFGQVLLIRVESLQSLLFIRSICSPVRRPVLATYASIAIMGGKDDGKVMRLRCHHVVVR